MTMTVRSSIKAVRGSVQASFLASGGTGPYVYSVAPSGAGGSINASTGLYTAPPAPSDDPALAFDTIIATDTLAATAQTQILVTDPIGLVADIIQRELGLNDDHIYLWDQKLMQPNDSSLYVAIGYLTSKPFANTNRYDGSGSNSNADQSVNMLAAITLDVISRSYEAVRRKEEVLMALISDYAQQQMSLNTFYIGRLPPGNQFVNLSHIDGSAIPYRFQITVNIQYFASKVKAVPYMDDFPDPEVTAQP